ncbi:TPA: class Ib ribonucleoside-diphosphate reductase assembly flavoprotein NrdI, partial [Enterococcus faecalis]|nr:class Ib ribonucleoside-diphosphate reductase assembly flavoprotein NrdI [Enterococcus faecalis]
MNIRYISISGNTRSFVQRLTTYAEEQHQQNEKNPTITFKEISENSPLEVETEPFFTFVPTYLDGGDG